MTDSASDYYYAFKTRGRLRRVGGRALCKLGRHKISRWQDYAAPPREEILCGQPVLLQELCSEDTPGAELVLWRGDCWRCGW